ncbi:MAG: hypothetical protein ACSLFO_02005 [Acidimicrobiales bacterium]
MAMTSPATPPSASPTPASVDRDWPAKATETIVEQVGKIRDKTTGPALKVARYAVFAAFAVSLGTVALIIFVIGAVRALDVYLPDAVFGETHTWAAHSIIGLVLLLAGLVIFARKARRRDPA